LLFLDRVISNPTVVGVAAHPRGAAPSEVNTLSQFTEGKWELLGENIGDTYRFGVVMWSEVNQTM